MHKLNCRSTGPRFQSRKTLHGETTAGHVGPILVPDVTCLGPVDLLHLLSCPSMALHRHFGCATHGTVDFDCACTCLLIFCGFCTACACMSGPTDSFACSSSAYGRQFFLRMPEVGFGRFSACSSSAYGRQRFLRTCFKLLSVASVFLLHAWLRAALCTQFFFFLEYDTAIFDRHQQELWTILTQRR